MGSLKSFFLFFFSQTENEENVLICLRIIIELHKQFRPAITQEVSHNLLRGIKLTAVLFRVAILFKWVDWFVLLLPFDVA